MENILIWLVLGLFQGVTDVFPISSLGHLALLRQLLGAQAFDLSLATGLHGGSFMAIAIFFRKELKTLWINFTESLSHLKNWIGRKERYLLLSPEGTIPYLYGFSLIPVAIEGFTLKYIANEIFNQRYIPLILLILNGVIILITALVVRGERTIKELSWKEFLFIGITQGLAVLPGISRLGLVLCAGLWCRLKWQDALKLTFVISIPVVFGALTVEAGDIVSSLEKTPGSLWLFLTSIILAGLCSWFSLKLLTSRLLERRKLVLFGYYSLMLGSFSLAYLYFWK